LLPRTRLQTSQPQAWRFKSRHTKGTKSIFIDWQPNRIEFDAAFVRFGRRGSIEFDETFVRSDTPPGE